MNEATPAFAPTQRLPVEDLRDAWHVLDPEERVEGFRALAPEQAEEFFLGLPTHDELELLRALTLAERRLWARRLAPDDAADLIQEAAEEERATLIGLFDEPMRREVVTLLAYEEDAAGGLMSPRFARMRPEMSVDEAISYLRRQASRQLETLYYCYVLDAHQRLLGVVSLRELFLAKGATAVSDVMHSDLVTVREDVDQEAVGRLFARHDLLAIPVVDGDGRMKGIVTVDDIVDVVQEEATEDIQKIGGTEVLDAPYMEVGIFTMWRKRAVWLTVLFLAQLLTVAVLVHFQARLDRLTTLALFIPWIISSGGNSGSQATTLVIRAMALREVRSRDWSRVLLREAAVGLALGLLLGLLGLLRVVVWPVDASAGALTLRLGLAIASSLLGVVLWGTFIGSMLPFLLRRLRLDPASASAPLVATLCDVIGLVIYFNVASMWLGELF